MRLRLARTCGGQRPNLLLTVSRPGSCLNISSNRVVAFLGHLGAAEVGGELCSTSEGSGRSEPGVGPVHHSFLI